MSASVLSNSQFYTEQKLLGQGNSDELTTRVRGVQNMTANIFKPSFSSDLTTVRSSKAPASASAQQSGEEDVE